MHRTDPLVQKKSKTDFIGGLACHQLPVKVCEINPLPHTLPVGTDKTSSTYRKVASAFGTDLRSPASEPRSYVSRRQELHASAIVVQLEDDRLYDDSLSSIALTEIDGWAVPLLNTIFCANDMVAFNLNNAEYAFVFEPGGERAQPVTYAPEILATVFANNHRFGIGLEHMNFIDALDGVHTHKLPEQIQCAFYEAWFGSIFEKLEQWRGARIHVESLKWRPDILENDEYHLCFSLSRQSDKLETKGHVSMGRGAMQWLAEGYAQKTNNGNFPGVDQFPFDLCFEIGWMKLDAEEFNRLGSNDILLPDTCSFNDYEKSVLVRMEHGPCWLGNIERGIVTITAAREITMGNEIDAQHKAPGQSVGAAGQQKTMAGNNNEAAGSAHNAVKTSENQGQKELLAAAVIDGLQIDLVFEVGRRKVTLQELKKIKPGFTFDLATPRDRYISVVANGRTVGKGTLVQIDQRIGVRLVEIIT